MKYNVSFKISNPQNKEESKMIKAIVEFVTQESGYGNKTMMGFKWDKSCVGFFGEPQRVFDIRYDKRYKPSNQEKYIETIIREEMYTGRNGAWKPSYLKIKPIFELA